MKIVKSAVFQVSVVLMFLFAIDHYESSHPTVIRECHFETKNDEAYWVLNGRICAEMHYGTVDGLWYVWIPGTGQRAGFSWEYDAVKWTQEQKLFSKGQMR